LLVCHLPFRGHAEKVQFGIQRANEVAILDTVIVSFENEKHLRKIMILLEKESGKLIASWLTPASKFPQQ
jgi:hypothetical protein